MPSRDSRDLGAERITRADFARRVDEGRKGDAQTSGAVIGADVDVMSIGIENAANGETLWSKRIRADDAKGGDLVYYAAWYVGGLVQCAQSSLSVGERLKDVDLFGFFVRACDSWRDAALLFYPETRILRTDPRFKALAERYGVTDYWNATGKWPDFCDRAGQGDRCSQYGDFAPI